MLAVLTLCSQPSSESISGTHTLGVRIDSAAKTLITRFAPPDGYQRLNYEKGTFQYYLTNFPLKPIDAKVYYYSGKLKANKDVYASVFDIDVGEKDLQQCADAVIRLRAEYLYAQKRFNEIHFNFTNGFRVDYVKWAKGYRLKVSGNNTSWYKAGEEDYSYKNFKAYLEIIFSFAGTLSLTKELNPIPSDSVQVGDVFIKGGSPGHAVIIVDVAIGKINQKRIFMIAQSYMPAQSIHLLVNRNDKDISPWYDLSQTDQLYSPEWTFEKTALKRFKN